MSVPVFSARRALTICSGLTVIVFCTLIVTSYNTDHSQSAQAAIAHRVASIATTKQGVQDDLLEDISNATLGVSRIDLRPALLADVGSKFQKIFMINLPTRTDRKDAGTLAAALTGLKVDFVEAISHVDEKAWPPGGKETNLNRGGAGAWRSHLNVIRT